MPVRAEPSPLRGPVAAFERFIREHPAADGTPRTGFAVGNNAATKGTLKITRHEGVQDIDTRFGKEGSTSGTQ